MPATSWSQSTAAVKFVKDQLNGGLKGKKIAFLFFDNPAGREPIPILEDLSVKEGYQLKTFAGRWHGEGLELVALLDREVLEDRNRLTARRVVEEEEGDLLALEAAVELVLDELHGGGGLRPGRRSDRKDVGVPASVGGGGLPEAG